MTVPNQSLPYSQYTGTGDRTFFEYGYENYENSGVFVLVDGRTVNYVAQETGVVITPAPALDAVVILYRLTDITQLADFEAFESFTGLKTEDAVDKLIYLKQEAAVWRADMNIRSDPSLAFVTINNDKGDNAVIFLWNENVAGMFAGEVTQQMPNAGTFVDKPEDFAYFQWGSAAQEITYTTTLYPIEVVEGLDVGIALQEIAMREIPNDSLDISYSQIYSLMRDLLLATGPYDDALDISYSQIFSQMRDLLLETGPYDDALDMSYSHIFSLLVPKLVKADMPDEGLDIGIALLDVTMTPI
jgi:hypothetical protein